MLLGTLGHACFEGHTVWSHPRNTEGGAGVTPPQCVGAIRGPSWSILGAALAILGNSGAILAGLLVKLQDDHPVTKMVLAFLGLYECWWLLIVLFVN